MPSLKTLLTDRTRLDLKDIGFLAEQKDERFRHRPARDITEFVTSTDYLDAGAEAWPEVIKELEKFYKSGRNEGLFECGIGAGKSYMASIIACFEIHNLLCLSNPQKEFGLAKGSKIAFMNMSVNAGQAKKVVFGEIKARIDNSPWFREYAPYNPDKLSELEFPGDIFIIPGNSGTTFPLGYNIFCGLLDELAFYQATKTQDAAEEIYYAMKRRVVSRFKSFGKVIAITSPSHVNSFVERMQKRARTDRRIYAIRKASFEMSPKYGKKYFWFNTRNMKCVDGAMPEQSERELWRKVPQDLRQEFTVAPERAMRDFLAMPSNALEPYFKDTDKVRACFDFDPTPLENLEPKPSCVYFAHVDLGLRRDAAGVAIAHEEAAGVIFDYIGRIVAAPGGEVDFESIRQIFFDLKRRGFQIGGVSYDGFQSADSIQALTKENILAEVRSVDRNTAGYDTLKEMAYRGKIHFPRVDFDKVEADEPRTPEEWLYVELKSVELIEGKKVDHPTNGSKDVADAVAGVCTWVATEEKMYAPAPALIVGGKKILLGHKPNGPYNDGPF